MKLHRVAEILKYRDLPDYPDLFLDFAENLANAAVFFPRRPDQSTLSSQAEEIRKRSYPREQLCNLLGDQAVDFQNQSSLAGIEKLRHRDTVAVLARQTPGLYGGNVSALLSCLTAIKLSLDLETRGSRSVPVLWIDGDRPSTREALSLLLPDRARGDWTRWPEGIEGIGRKPFGELLVPPDTDAQLREIGSSGEEVGRTDGTVALLQSAYAPGTTITGAFARFLASLTKEWGLILLDSSNNRLQELVEPLRRKGHDRTDAILAAVENQRRRLRNAGYETPGKHSPDPTPLLEVVPHSVIPSVAYVADPQEFVPLAESLPLFSMLDLNPPLVWPRVGATVLDNRSSRILHRYGRNLQDLFMGPARAREELVEEQLMPETALKFSRLAESVDRRLSDLLLSLPPEEDSLAEVIESSKTKMLYQLGKLKEKYEKAEGFRRETMRRQLETTCSFLAPAGRLQERVASICMMKRYSSQFVRLLFERIDVYLMEHQTLSLD